TTRLSSKIKSAIAPSFSTPRSSRPKTAAGSEVILRTACGNVSNLSSRTYWPRIRGKSAKVWDADECHEEPIAADHAAWMGDDPSNVVFLYLVVDPAAGTEPARGLLGCAAPARRDVGEILTRFV